MFARRFHGRSKRLLNLCGFQDFEALESRDHAGFLTQSLVLTKRSFVNMFRDLGYYWLRLAIYVGLGYGLASIYHDLGSSYGSIQVNLKNIA